jgi:4-amino-4-deoxy-L-arabinose transferase-like glycosyltransferase
MNLPRWLPLLLVLLCALALRLALWDNLPRQGMISDEAEYLAAADWLAHGRGFAWHQGWLWTRAPLYPLFLAAHMWLFGFALEPIYLSQIALSLLNVALVYVLARHVVGGAWRAALAALLAALYLPFAAYPQMILGETLYISLLLGLFVVLGSWAARLHQEHAHPGTQAARLALAGLLLGMATLTRGLTLGFVPLVLLWVAWVAWRAGGLRAAALLALVCAMTIAPWSLYASRLYGGPVLVDTTGAFNLLLGARTAYDGERRDAPPRQFVLALLDEGLTQQERRDLLAGNAEHEGACLWRRNDPRLLAALERPPADITQAERQRLMLAEGLCLLRAAPGAFVLKSASELIDLFQINYTGAERMSGGFTLGRLPPWYALALFVLDDTLYVLLLPLAVLGWGVAARRREHGAGAAVLPLTVLVGAWWLYNVLTAPLLFAINRFRMPLLPFACIFAVVGLCWLAAWLWRRRPEPRPRQVWPFAVLALLLALVAWSPYAYLQEPPASRASYLGPYPSSLRNTQIALAQRPTYLHQQQLIEALGAGDADAARALLAAYDDLPPHIRALALPLLEGLEGNPARGLELLPAPDALAAARNWRGAVVRGDLLRRLDEPAAAKAAFTPGYVDDNNPVAWAWRWLRPVPTQRIDLAGNLDLGYIAGFYLGEGDPGAGGTFRWSAGEARLLFPAQGRSAPQQLCLRADGRGWPPDLAPPTVRLLHEPAVPDAAAQPFGSFVLQHDVSISCAEVPPTTPGADVEIVVRSETFVPPAADLLAQQGPQAGQLRLLGVRLDWAELTPALPKEAQP